MLLNTSSLTAPLLAHNSKTMLILCKSCSVSSKFSQAFQIAGQVYESGLKRVLSCNSVRVLSTHAIAASFVVRSPSVHAHAEKYWTKMKLDSAYT